MQEIADFENGLATLDRTALRRASQGDKVFLGEMTHPEHRHKRPDDLVALWDAEHPDDPVED